MRDTWLGRTLYGVLDIPAVYALTQALLVPGSTLDARVAQILAERPPAGPVVDVGCGPRSWLGTHRPDAFCVDLTWQYVQEGKRRGGRFLQGDATRLPLASGCAGAIWSVFLLHHLPDPLAHGALEEMVRVCAPGGQVVVIDGVYPEPAWRNPFAWAIRRLDRGAHMRRQAELEGLLPGREGWRIERFRYSLNGLEGLACRYQAPA